MMITEFKELNFFICVLAYWYTSVLKKDGDFVNQILY